MKSAEEIEKIIEVCRDNGIKPVGNVFTKSAEEIEKIIEVCKVNGIEITGSVFMKSAEKIVKIIEVCKANEIEMSCSVFLKSAEEIVKIIEVCKANEIKITGSVFQKSSKDINETCEYLRENYGSEYVKPLLAIISVKKLKTIFPYLESLGVLPTVINSASILTLSLEEIQERKSVLDMLGESMVVGNRYNYIFGLSKKNYAKKLESLNISSGGRSL